MHLFLFLSILLNLLTSKYYQILCFSQINSVQLLQYYSTDEVGLHRMNALAI